MNDQFEDNWSDLVFGLIGIVWIAVVVAMLWTFVKGFWQGVADEEPDARP